MCFLGGVSFGGLGGFWFFFCLVGFVSFWFIGGFFGFWLVVCFVFCCCFLQECFLRVDQNNENRVIRVIRA